MLKAQDLQNLLVFMERVNMSGKEAVTYCLLMKNLEITLMEAQAEEKRLAEAAAGAAAAGMSQLMQTNPSSETVKPTPAVQAAIQTILSEAKAQKDAQAAEQPA